MSGANTGLQVYFNSDGASNYGYNKTLTIGSASVAGSSVAGRIGLNDASTSPMFVVADIYNASATRKHMTWSGDMQAVGASAPETVTGAAVWNNTSSQITQMTFLENGSATLTSGTVIQVWGHN
jgi:hypothetical protein